MFPMFRPCKRRLYIAVRRVRTSALAHANHYDVLGITPKATQNDIKSAYYKLSKVHHPDMSDSDESARKFRAIKEAYEVLGNVQLKKMYDKGLIVGQENRSRMDYHPEPEPTDPVLKFYKSRQKRNVVPTMDGRTPVYNFDDWSKHHYGDLLKKNQRNKDYLRKKHVSEQEILEGNRQEVLLYMMFALGGLFFFCVINGTSDYDKISNNKKSRDASNTTDGDNS